MKELLLIVKRKEKTSPAFLMGSRQRVLILEQTFRIDPGSQATRKWPRIGSYTKRTKSFSTASAGLCTLVLSQGWQRSSFQSTLDLFPCPDYI
jgi:hypothetical protein